jgi:hypothetical protein
MYAYFMQLSNLTYSASIRRILLQETYQIRRAKKRERQHHRQHFERLVDPEELDEFRWEDFDDHVQATTESSSNPKTKLPKERKRYFELVDGNEVESNTSYFCCPQKFEVIQPSFGRNRFGEFSFQCKIKSVVQSNS